MGERRGTAPSHAVFLRRGRGTRSGWPHAGRVRVDRGSRCPPAGPLDERPYGTDNGLRRCPPSRPPRFSLASEAWRCRLQSAGVPSDIIAMQPRASTTDLRPVATVSSGSLQPATVGSPSKLRLSSQLGQRHPSPTPLLMTLGLHCAWSVRVELESCLKALPNHGDASVAAPAARVPPPIPAEKPSSGEQGSRMLRRWLPDVARNEPRIGVTRGARPSGRASALASPQLRGSVWDGTRGICPRGPVRSAGWPTRRLAIPAAPECRIPHAIR